MATRPLADTASRLTAESDWIVATGLRILRKSQMRAVRSSDPEMIWNGNGKFKKSV